MANQRCPMCGKENPAELETCQYCQARLVPQEPAGRDEKGSGDPNWPEWLRSSYDDETLQAASNEDEQDTDGEDFPEQDLPDWLLHPSGESQPGQPEASWDLTRSPGDDATGEALFPSADLRGKAEDDRTEDQPPAEVTSVPDQTQESSTKIDQAREEPAGAVEADQPEWLLRVRARQREDEQEQTQDPQAGANASSSLSAGESADESAAIPGWLAALGEESRESAEESTPPGGQDEALPEWLGGLNKIEEPVEKSGPVEGSLPDWLASGVYQRPVEQTESGEQTPGSGQEPQENTPGWIRAVSMAGTTDRDQTDLTPVEGVEKSPDDLVSSSVEDQVGQPAETEALFTGETTERPIEVPAEEGSSLAAEEQATPEELAAAELPPWLTAMRPMTSVAASTSQDVEEDNRLESTGPLTGLRGVLAAEPEIIKGQKPPVYTSMLQVSDVHQTMASLLQEMVAAEGQPAPAPRRATRKAESVVRVVIALILFTAILLPRLISALQSELPDFSVETGSAIQLVEGLSPAAPVLVAVDYEPGFSGEMDAAAAGVIDHLMIKGAYLALVSTSPSGPAQAERLLQRVNLQGQHQYFGQTQYANLGFIPGGPSGLAGLAQSPRQVLPFALPSPGKELDNSADIWASSPLRSVNRLADFSMVLVLTESPDTARAWIEQVQGRLEDTPLVMVISAQAEPMVLPYYLSNPQQVQGIVAGLSGGAAYENLNNRNILATGSWSQFSLGLLVAVVIFLVSAIPNSLESRPKPPDQKNETQGEVLP